MTNPPHVLAIVLAGGEGKRLHPLTRDRAKPAVPFGGQYRLIDFALSNLVDGGFRHIVALTTERRTTAVTLSLWRLNAHLSRVPDHPEGMAADESGNISAGPTGGYDASPFGGCLQKPVFGYR